MQVLINTLCPFYSRFHGFYRFYILYRNFSKIVDCLIQVKKVHVERDASPCPRARERSRLAVVSSSARTWALHPYKDAYHEILTSPNVTLYLILPYVISTRFSPWFLFAFTEIIFYRVLHLPSTEFSKAICTISSQLKSRSLFFDNNESLRFHLHGLTEFDHDRRLRNGCVGVTRRNGWSSDLRSCVDR